MYIVQVKPLYIKTYHIIDIAVGRVVDVADSKIVGTRGTIWLKGSSSSNHNNNISDK